VQVSDGEQKLGRVIADFTAEFANEMSVRANECVYVTKHVDNEWSSCVSFDGHRHGIVPTSFIHIEQMVQQTENGSQAAHQTGSKPPDRRMVLYDYSTNEPGDLHARAGDIVRIVKYVDAEWVIAENEATREQGAIAFNYLDKSQATTHYSSDDIRWRKPISANVSDLISNNLQFGGQSPRHNQQFTTNRSASVDVAPTNLYPSITNTQDSWFNSNIFEDEKNAKQVNINNSNRVFEM
jgi:hypothetical protein